MSQRLRSYRSAGGSCSLHLGRQHHCESRTPYIGAFENTLHGRVVLTYDVRVMFNEWDTITALPFSFRTDGRLIFLSCSALQCLRTGGLASKRFFFPWCTTSINPVLGLGCTAAGFSVSCMCITEIATELLGDQLLAADHEKDHRVLALATRPRVCIS